MFILSHRGKKHLNVWFRTYHSGYWFSIEYQPVVFKQFDKWQCKWPLQKVERRWIVKTDFWSYFRCLVSKKAVISFRSFNLNNDDFKPSQKQKYKLNVFFVCFLYFIMRVSDHDYRMECVETTVDNSICRDVFLYSLLFVVIELFSFIFIFYSQSFRIDHIWSSISFWA